MELFDDGPGRCPPLTAQMVTRAESALGYRLPPSYLDVLRQRNGGDLARGRFPTDRPTHWASDHVLCRDLIGIGCEDGLDGPTGSRYLIAEWGYPDIGVVISSDGHTAFMLDYSACGPQGEPGVAYVDVEADPGQEVLALAPTFAAFVAGLVEDTDEDG